MTQRLWWWGWMWWLLMTSSSVASTQILMGGNVGNSSTSASVYMTLMGGPLGSWTATEVNAQFVISTAGTFRNLYIEVSAAPGGSTSYVFTVRLNGVGTALTCTVSGSNTSCNDTSNNFAVVAGDEVTLESSPAGGTPTATAPQWSVRFDSTTSSYSLLGSSTNTGNHTNGQFMPVVSMEPGDLTETDVDIIVPTAGTLRNLYVELTAAPGGSDSRGYTLRVNEASTGLTASASGASTTGNNTSNTVAVVAGDRINYIAVVVGAPTAARARIGMTFDADTAGEFIFGLATDNALTGTGTTEYLEMVAGDDNILTTAASQLAQSMTVKAIYIRTSVVAGAGNTVDYTLENNGSTTALTCQMAGGSAVTCNGATDITIANADNLTVKCVPSASAFGGRMSTGLLGFVSESVRRVLLVN